MRVDPRPAVVEADLPQESDPELASSVESLPALNQADGVFLPPSLTLVGPPATATPAVPESASEPVGSAPDQAVGDPVPADEAKAADGLAPADEVSDDGHDPAPADEASDDGHDPAPAPAAPAPAAPVSARPRGHPGARRWPRA